MLTRQQACKKMEKAEILQVNVQFFEAVTKSLDCLEASRTLMRKLNCHQSHVHRENFESEEDKVEDSGLQELIIFTMRETRCKFPDSEHDRLECIKIQLLQCFNSVINSDHLYESDDSESDIDIGVDCLKTDLESPSITPTLSTASISASIRADLINELPQLPFSSFSSSSSSSAYIQPSKQENTDDLSASHPQSRLISIPPHKQPLLTIKYSQSPIRRPSANQQSPGKRLSAGQQSCFR